MQLKFDYIETSPYENMTTLSQRAIAIEHETHDFRLKVEGSTCVVTICLCPLRNPVGTTILPVAPAPHVHMQTILGILDSDHESDMDT